MMNIQKKVMLIIDKYNIEELEEKLSCSRDKKMGDVTLDSVDDISSIKQIREKVTMNAI